MMIQINRRLTKHGYDYIVQNDSYILQSNYTFGIRGRRIFMKNMTAHNEFCLKQTNSIVKLLALIPLFWIFPIRHYPPYILYRNGKEIGKTKFQFCSPGIPLIINDHVYKLSLRKNNEVLLIKDNIKIALIRKIKKTVLEQNRYLIDINTTNNQEFDLILLLTALADLLFFPNAFRIDYLKYETTI